jgi:mono/diheme cytochrome c family protein
LPIGVVVSPNLTPGGPLKDWTDGEIFRELRSGVDRNGHHLIVMSSVPIRNMSDEDLQAVIAFLRSQPAVEHDTPNPPDQPSYLAAIMFGAGMLPAGLPPVADSIVAPAKGPTAEYGQYIVGYSGCRDCHGQNLRGGDPKGFAPVGPSLRIVKVWTAEQFVKTLRTGVDPSGMELGTVMPWKVISRMDDNDLTAVYQYLASLP